MGSLIKSGRSNSGIMNPFATLQHEMNKVMDDFYDLFETGKPKLESFDNLRLSPPVDVVEDDKSYKLEVEMPGMGEEDIQVSVDGHVLTIEGEKSTSKKDEKKNYISREISYGRYVRSITLPESADLDKASASFKKGMLWVEIPKKAGSQSKKRKIDIKKAK
ncbi:Hsp20/alpha crystallin family protein [Legionella israelensis]|uniref:Hsp20/alpha crystallin family protein n=1 Tax=Legionella israelensis TaxID=454 RepID=A0AAX1EKD7_9GAMM|nr:Hsp20/alpha crystallin family protein [Legionella israelensis]QBR85287.1 Hsp20/alpha crystallin family protein [Legionella israelensis]